MRILRLTLKRKWFDLIASGVKKEEYRELKDYWHTRFRFSPTNTKPFDSVEFTNGYGDLRPAITFELVSMRIDTGKEEWGAMPNRLYYVLTLGNEISRNNMI